MVARMSHSPQACRPLLQFTLLLLATSACSKEPDPASKLLHKLVESVAVNDRAAVTQLVAPSLRASALPKESTWDVFVTVPAKCLGDGLKAGNTLRPAESLIVGGESFEKVMLITSPCGEVTIEDGSNVVTESTVTIVSIKGQWFVGGFSMLEGLPIGQRKTKRLIDAESE